MWLARSEARVRGLLALQYRQEFVDPSAFRTLHAGDMRPGGVLLDECSYVRAPKTLSE